MRQKRKGVSPVLWILAGYVGTILLGTALLALPFARTGSIPFVDLAFTATSAVSVTGLGVLDVSQAFTGFGQAVLLLLIEFGGLGFMTVATVVLTALGRRISLKYRLALTESAGAENLHGMVRLVRTYAVFSLLVQLGGALLLLPATLRLYPFGEALFKSVFHAVSSYCNAGVDLFAGALGSLAQNPLFALVSCLLVVLGGLGVGILLEFAQKKKFRKLSLNAKIIFSATAFLVLFGTIFFLICESGNPQTLGNLPFGQKLLAALFQSVMPRTAGFAGVTQSALTQSGQVMTFLLMIVGGAPASTAGGIKVTTLVILFAATATGLRGKEEVTLGRNGIAQKTVLKAVALAGVYVGILLVGLLIVSVTEAGSGHTLWQLLFEEVSALSNVGYTLDLTPLLTAGGKTLILFMMLLGRCGLLSFALILPDASYVPVRYREAHVAIG